MVGSEVSTLIRNIEAAFDGVPWYGTLAMRMFGTLHWQYVNLKPFGTMKSVAMLLRHMVGWRIFVLKKLEGDSDYDIEIDSKLNWPDVIIENEEERSGILSDFQETQTKLLQSMASLEDGFLREKVLGKPYDFQFLLGGVSEHDIYHLGQIFMVYSMVKPE